MVDRCAGHHGGDRRIPPRHQSTDRYALKVWRQAAIASRRRQIVRNIAQTERLLDSIYSLNHPRMERVGPISISSPSAIRGLRYFLASESSFRSNGLVVVDPDADLVCNEPAVPSR